MYSPVYFLHLEPFLKAHFEGSELSRSIKALYLTGQPSPPPQGSFTQVLAVQFLALTEAEQEVNRTRS